MMMMMIQRVKSKKVLLSYHRSFKKKIIIIIRIAFVTRTKGQINNPNDIQTVVFTDISINI